MALFKRPVCKMIQILRGVEVPVNTYSLFFTNHLPAAEYMVWYIGRRVVGVLMDPSFSYNATTEGLFPASFSSKGILSEKSQLSEKAYDNSHLLSQDLCL